MEVGAIIPAYNEEKTIGNVLSVLGDSALVDHILVVSDGSEDRTVEAASVFEEVTMIELLENRGKGGAVKAGLDRCPCEIILVLDADLVGLTEEHIDALVRPVLDGETMMTIGIFQKGRAMTDMAQKMAPFLSGQRAIKRELLENISGLDLSRFGLEVALHKYVDDNGIEPVEVQLTDLSHVMKEEKLGFWRGVLARAKMYWEIFKYVIRIDTGPR